MAKPKTYSWSKFIILVGDAATPTEAFVAICALTSKGMEFSGDTADVSVPDCANPDLPAWAERIIRTKTATISGDGVMDLPSRDIFWTWYDSGLSRNVQVKLDAPLADKGGTWSGKFLLTTYNVTGNQDDAKISHALTMQSDGPIIFTPALTLMDADAELAEAA